jgi:hypothetical protein
VRDVGWSLSVCYWIEFFAYNWFLLVIALFVPLLLFLLCLLKRVGKIGFFSLGTIYEVLTGWAETYILEKNLVDLSCFAL